MGFGNAHYCAQVKKRRMVRNLLNLSYSLTHKMKNTFENNFCFFPSYILLHKHFKFSLKELCPFCSTKMETEHLFLLFSCCWLLDCTQLGISTFKKDFLFTKIYHLFYEQLELISDVVNFVIVNKQRQLMLNFFLRGVIPDKSENFKQRHRQLCARIWLVILATMPFDTGLPVQSRLLEHDGFIKSVLILLLINDGPFLLSMFQ